MASMLYITDGFRIEVPGLARPTIQELRAVCPGIDSIEYDVSPTGPTVVVPGTVFAPEESNPMGGHEYEERFKPFLSTLIGYQQLRWFVMNQGQLQDSGLFRRRMFVAGLGLVVVDRRGLRRFPYLGRMWPFGRKARWGIKRHYLSLA